MALMGETVNGISPYQFRSMTPTVSLSRLIDFSIQKTYHELVVLADLLPRKSDMERKIEIVSFANRTRQMFVRLLALVKWAGSASKVEKCATIVSFLDKQSLLFTDTADVLSKMARESLVQARLPSFQLPCAVEVLTLGTYSRLPSCIRERIVPPDPVTPVERRCTLLRLNQIIQQRLVTSSLPPQMRNLKIENGRVVFHVNYEFELSLTLMGDNPGIPWRVLNVEIMVVDKETGDGKELVHPLQVMFLQELVQSRLIDNSKPLLDAYNVLHSFCLSLQLEVLHAQAIRLSRDRLGDFIRVEEYIPGRRLSIIYWRDQPVGEKMGYRLCIEIDSQESCKPLQVLHYPELGEKEASHANDAIKSDHLSVEKLLIHTTHERAKQSLNRLRTQFEEIQMGDCDLSGSPPILEISFLQPCMMSERLLVAVDSLTGVYLAHIPQFDECPVVSKFQDVLKRDVSKIKLWIKDLRIWVTKERCKKTAESLPVYVHENLPFNSSKNHPILSSPSAKLYFQFSRHHQYFLMIAFDEEPNGVEIEQKYFLMSVDFVSLETLETPSAFEVELPKSFLQLNSILEMDMLSLFRSKPEAIFEDVSKNGKRKQLFSNSLTAQVLDQTDSAKKPKVSGFFIRNLAYLICFCEEKLAYGALSSELQRRSICHQVRASDEPGFTHLVDIVQFPPQSSAPPSKLQADLLNSNIRLQGKSNKVWLVSLSFCNCPLQSQASKEHSLRRMVYLMYDFSNGSQSQIVQMVDELLEDWAALEKLYDVVCEFGKLALAGNYLSLVEVKSLSYKKLVLGYGPNRNYTSAEKRFQLCFGVVGIGSSNSNPHVLVATQLQHEFNQNHSIAALVQTLNATFSPLLTVSNLTSIPLLGVINSRPQVPVQTFTIIPQTSTHIRLLYRNVYCVDVVFQLDGLVAIRDGAYSLFDKGKVLEDLTPIQGLKAFLSKFVDKTATQMRRLSQTEDDNPPSPVAQLDSVESYLFSVGQNKTSSPLTIGSNPGDLSGGMRGLHHSLGSNPNTPSSPHTSVLSQTGYLASPNTSFPLSSPPSHGLGGHQPPGLPLGSHPEQSPGNLFGVNSPVNPLHAPSPSFLPTPSPSAPASTHLQSPASNYISSAHDHSQVHSPFQPPGSSLSMASPAAGPWPNSPSIPRPSPSRVHGSVQSPAGSGQPLSLGTSPQSQQHHVMQIHAPYASARLVPQRPWAAAIPTLITHQGFESMSRPSLDGSNIHQPFYNSIYALLPQLERFLGCVSMRANLQRVIRQDENFALIQALEPGIIQFKNDSMQFKITLHPTTLQSIHLKIIPVAEFKNQWVQEEFEILERFFEAKVVCAPYKPNAFLAYGRLLNAPKQVQKHCIQLMRLELHPDSNLKWTLQWCLTIPPAAQIILGSPGMSSIIIFGNTTMLFFIQFTKISMNLPVGIEPPTVVVPFVYHIQTNVLQVAPDRRDPQFASANLLGVISGILKRYQDYHVNPGECSIFPAIRDVMMNDLVS